MKKVRQSAGWWAMRLLSGNCPTHGYALVGVAEGSDGYVVRCPKEDCPHSAIHVQRGDPLDRALSGQAVVLKAVA